MPKSITLSTPAFSTASSSRERQSTLQRYWPGMEGISSLMPVPSTTNMG